MAGVEHGFRITNANTNGAGAYYPNHKSALGENRVAVEAQIREEIANGRYQVVQERPTITSALGALIKTTGKVRLLHDASQLMPSFPIRLCTTPPRLSRKGFTWPSWTCLALTAV